MKILKYWKPILVSLFILYGSVTSSNNLNTISFLNFPYSDKLLHFSLYLVLSIFLYASLLKNTNYTKKINIIISFIMVVSYGILMEVFQLSFTSTRSAEILDVIANSFGCFVGILIYKYIKKYSFAQYL